MSKGTRYELLIYTTGQIEGDHHYQILSTIPFPAFTIGQVFKSFALEDDCPPEAGKEYRIRDIEMVHFTAENEPHVWQTKIRLVQVARRKRKALPMTSPATEEMVKRWNEEGENDSPEARVLRGHWELVKGLQG